MGVETKKNADAQVRSPPYPVHFEVETLMNGPPRVPERTPSQPKPTCIEGIGLPRPQTHVRRHQYGLAAHRPQAQPEVASRVVC